MERSADPIGVDETAIMNGARITRLRATIASLEKRAFLRLELGVVKIVCTPLIETTYTLEGDSCVALITYDKLQEMYSYLDTYTADCNFPGMDNLIDTCVTTSVTDYLD